MLTLLALGYVVFCYFYNRNNIFAVSDLNYYNYFINALLHKRLDLIIDFRHDLSLFNGKWYMYWGPAPVLYVLPFYLVGHLHVSDVFYTLVSGIVSIFLFYLAAKELIKYFKLKVSAFSFWLVITGFAIMSPNFYLSLGGSIWGTNQIVAIMYLLVFLLFFFKYLNQKRLAYFVIALIFINLAWLSRYTLIFYYALFLLLLKDKNYRLFIWVIINAGLAFLFFFVFNYLRFGSILETGFRFQQGALRYDYFFKHNQLFSLSNIPYNFYYYFLHPFELSLTPLKMRFDAEGNSVFLMYPLLVFNFLGFKNKLKNKRIIFFRNLCLLISGLILLVLLSNVGSGWRQFGSRYFLDVIPALYLLLFFVINSVFFLAQILLLVYGVLINTLGFWIFHQQ